MQTRTIELSKNACIDCYIPDPAIGFHEERPRPAVIVCPGGAYLIHATKEGEAIALEFCARGFAAFVLKYTVALDREHPEKGFNEAARYPVQALELFETIHILRAHKKELSLTDDIFLMGFSAGAHVCATAGTRWNDRELLQRLDFVPAGRELKASGMVLGYSMLSDNPKEYRDNKQQGVEEQTKAMLSQVLYGTETPTEEERASVDLSRWISMETVPTFIWHSADDPVVDSTRSTAFVLRLQEAGICCEYHLFDHGGHGLGLANKYYAHDSSSCDSDISRWPELAEHWMNRVMKRKASS